MASATKRGEKSKGPRLGVYYRSLTVENVRCFRDTQTLPLSDEEGRPHHWTLLLGENGTGKTTLLQALASSSFTGWDRNPDNTLRIGIVDRLEQVTRIQEAISELRPSSRFGAEPSFGYALLRENDAWEWALNTDEWAVNDRESTAFPQRPRLPVMQLCVYGPLRRPGATRLGSDDRDVVGDFLRGEVTSLDVEEWFLQRDYAASSKATEPAERERSRRWLDLAKQTVLSILPGVTDLVPRSTGGPSGQIRLYAVTEYGTVPFRELGFGMQSTLAWVVDLAVRMMSAYPDSDEPLSEPAVCLVDEIDLHLHPKWQRVLLQQLSERFPNVQFIATAHSPLIVQAAPDANVVVLRREKDRVVIDRAPESVRNWRVDQILTSDLFGLPSARPAALDDLFAERERLLAKEKPSAKDRARLDEIREEIGANPQGESPTLLEAEERLLRLTRARAEVVKASTPTPRRKKA